MHPKVEQKLNNEAFFKTKMKSFTSGLGMSKYLSRHSVENSQCIDVLLTQLSRKQNFECQKLSMHNNKQGPDLIEKKLAKLS